MRISWFSEPPGHRGSGTTPDAGVCKKSLPAKALRRVPLAAGLAALVASGAYAQDACPGFDGEPEGAEFCDLGTLGGQTRSTAQAVSGDGSVVVGGLLGDGAAEPAFRWSEADGIGALEVPGGTSASVARGVNADGSVIVGTVLVGDTYNAVRWVDGAVEDLGTSAGGGDSHATAVTADGTQVTGYARNTSDQITAFRWSETGGMQSIGTLAPTGDSWGRAISDDGRVIVGSASVPTTVIGGTTHAFRWVDGTGSMADLGTLDATDWSEARGVNADGSVVVGQSQSAEGYRAFRWVAGAGMTDLGTLEGGSESAANSVNADGRVVVGQSDDASGNLYAFRWVAGRGMESLGTLGGGDWSTAQDVSADGSIVVGTSGSSAGDRAFIWRTSDSGGSTEDLANLQGSIDALAKDTGQAVASQQSTVIQVVLVPLTPILQPVQVQVVPTGPRDSLLEHILATTSGVRRELFLKNGVQSVRTEYDDSAAATDYYESILDKNDRQTEFNAAQAAFELAQNAAQSAPSAATKEALAKAQATLHEAAGNLAKAVAVERKNRARVSDEDANKVRGAIAVDSSTLGYKLTISSSNHGRVDFSNRGNSFLTLRTSLGRTPADSAQAGAVSTTVAGLSYGRGVSDRLTLGLSADLSRQSLRDTAFDMKTSATIGLWAHYSADAGAGTGLQVSGGLGYTRAKGTVTRGQLFADVLEAQGQTTLATRTARVQVGYGVLAGTALRLTPSLELAHFETRRGGYTESGANFNASYDAQETGRTSLSLGLRGEKELGARDTLSFGLGVVRDLRVDAARITGTSDVPGRETFDLESPQDRNRTRPFASLGYVHRAEHGQSVSFEATGSKAEIGSRPDLSLSLGYHRAF